MNIKKISMYFILCVGLAGALWALEEDFVPLRIDAGPAYELWQTDKTAIFIDVREDWEWEEGYIPRAIHIPRSELRDRIVDVAQRDDVIIVYCSTGNRSRLATKMLRQMGYSRAQTFNGGIEEWAAKGYPINKP